MRALLGWCCVCVKILFVSVCGCMNVFMLECNALHLCATRDAALPPPKMHMHMQAHFKLYPQIQTRKAHARCPHHRVFIAFQRTAHMRRTHFLL